MKIGFTAGAFDIMHAGYMGLFREAKKHCDYLIVGLQIDPSLDRPDKNKPVQSLTDRMVVLNGLRDVDEVVCYSDEKDLYRLMKILPIDVYVIGSDWCGKPFTGHDLAFKIHYNPRQHDISTSQLRKRIADAEVFKR